MLKSKYVDIYKVLDYNVFFKLLSPNKIKEILIKPINYLICCSKKFFGTYNIAKLLKLICLFGFFLLFFLFHKFFKNNIKVNNIFNFGSSRAQIYNSNSNIKFKDIAGLVEQKTEIKEIVDFLKQPNKYTNLGGRLPKGILLIGPTGTGKTLLAKAVAGEAKVPFFSLSGSDFVEMFVGIGASRVRDLFKQAKLKKKAIIFIDEIDSIGRSRVTNNLIVTNDERENTLNQLLYEMDGFQSNLNLIVLAATNRPDILDKALLRPGRFDRHLNIDLPELKSRKQIFKIYIKKLTIKNNSNLDSLADSLAKQTTGFSGADIYNVCNEAALLAGRKNKIKIETTDFFEAIDRKIGGLENRNKIIKIKERLRIAFHESGHATVSWCVKHAKNLVKVTIIPRGNSLGLALYLPTERQITTEKHMKDEICVNLGGRAAEYLIFKDFSTGALNDLEIINNQAKSMVLHFGFSSLGNISYYNSIKSSYYKFSKPYSELRAQQIDKEITNLIHFQYKRALKILTQHKKEMTLLAKELLKKETLIKKDLETIFCTIH
ncbi:ATP-dependent zinc metalloprotease FtsH [Candidatus Karelsulcia muelleri]